MSNATKPVKLTKEELKELKSLCIGSGLSWKEIAKNPKNAKSLLEEIGIIFSEGAK